MVSSLFTSGAMRRVAKPLVALNKISPRQVPASPYINRSQASAFRPRYQLGLEPAMPA